MMKYFLIGTIGPQSQLVISLFLLFSSMTNSLSHSLSLCGCGH